MPKYEVILYWSERDKAFIAEVPELPGCAADGKTYQEALANVEIIIREWLETAPMSGNASEARRVAESKNQLQASCARRTGTVVA